MIPFQEIKEVCRSCLRHTFYSLRISEIRFVHIPEYTGCCIIRTTKHFDSFGITGRIIVLFINGERQTTWSKVSINFTLAVIYHHWEQFRITGTTQLGPTVHTFGIDSNPALCSNLGKFLLVAQRLIPLSGHLALTFDTGCRNNRIHISNSSSSATQIIAYSSSPIVQMKPSLPSRTNP